MCWGEMVIFPVFLRSKKSIYFHTKNICSWHPCSFSHLSICQNIANSKLRFQCPSKNWTTTVPKSEHIICTDWKNCLDIFPVFSLSNSATFAFFAIIWLRGTPSILLQTSFFCTKTQILGAAVNNLFCFLLFSLQSKAEYCFHMHNDNTCPCPFMN